ncbi:MAG: two-component regulator propeller domain-containing protein [Spirosomataceae bacterium]
MRIIYAIVTLLCVYQSSVGQQQEYNFINYSSKDGLSSNTTNVILKDKYGFMWFGTEGGLNRFDGQSFTAFKHYENDSNSIGRGSVMAMVEDKNGNLWVGTNLNLSVYNRSLNNFTNYDLSKIGWIRSLCADYRGNLWIGTYTGLFYFNTKTKKIKTYKAKLNIPTQLNSDVILCVFEDHKKNIWIGTKEGLHLFDPHNETFKRFIHQSQSLQSISDNTVRTIAEDIYGNLWIGTDKGGLNVKYLGQATFEYFKSREANATTLSSDKIFKISFDKSGKLWVGTEAGLNIFDPACKEVVRIKSAPPNKYDLFGNLVGFSVREIYIDPAGLYWISTFQGGVNKYDSNLALFNHTPFNPFNTNGLSAPSVTSFAENSQGNIYIGTDGGGLNIFDYDTKKIRSLPLNTPQGNAKDILALEKVDNQLWIGTYLNGLFTINLVTHSVRHLNLMKDNTTNTYLPINCFKNDGQGHLWIGTNGSGVYRYTPKSGELIPFEKLLIQKNNELPLNGYITTIEEDKQGNIWIGSNGSGMAVFDPIQKKVKILNHANSQLPMDKVLSIYADHTGKIWVGVLGGGLALYDSDRKIFHQFSEEHLLSNNVIYKILEDNDGKLWVSTNQGISTFDIAKKRFKNYTHQNGIQQSTFNVGAGLKTSRGEIFFGGLDGFNYFNPKNLYQNKNTPPLVVTNLKINNKLTNPIDNSEISDHISVAKEIKLSYKQNFSLDFVALNYTSPHESQYSYMLEGFDKEWNNVGTVTTAIYTNIDPGSYKFRLKAKSEDGAWQTPETTIDIIVSPPFWRTYYAYFLYFILFATTLWAIRRQGIQKLKNEFALAQERLEVKLLIEKERSEAERKMELEQSKIKFLTNLSHELKTPLTLILNPIEALLVQEKNKESFQSLHLINRNAKRLLNIVNQLLDLKKIEENELQLKLSENDIISFTKEIFDSFRYISERKHIHLDFDCSINEYYSFFDKDKVERILLNLLSNAIKFTNENGRVYLHIESDPAKGLKFIIGDTGIGMSPQVQGKIFERFFQSNNKAAILNQGSGIGLSIAQEFIKLHGGVITVESQEEIGSVFSVYLPLMPLSSKSITYELTEVNPEAIFSFNLDYQLKENDKIGKPIVLIVDDSEDLRTYLRENLKTNFRIIEAADGKQGWQKALAAHPEIIISDVNMPNMDVIELIKKLKNDHRTKHIPVILLTVLEKETDQLKGLESGANDYLTKPFSFKLLNVKINNLLNLNDTFKSTYTKQIHLEVSQNAIVSEDEKFLLKIGHYIDEHITDPDLSVEELSQKMCMSRGTLYNKILSITGETPVEYVRSIRLKKAIALLEKSDMKISQIGYEVGFSTPNYFTR